MNLILDSVAASQKQLLYSSTSAVVQSQTMSRLAQSASIIQGQMAASQIPLCIVQDQSGQLHQLVYMVPEHLYQSYIAAAARGMKVNLPPKLDRLNGFLPGASVATNDAKSSIIGAVANKPVTTVTEKIIKYANEADSKDKKLKINTKDILDLKSEVLKGNLPTIKTQKSEPQVKKTIYANVTNNTSVKPIMNKTTTRPSTPNKTTNHVQVTQSTNQKNDIVSKRIYTVTPNIHGLREAHFLTNELFPLIKTNKNEPVGNNSNNNNNNNNKNIKLSNEKFTNVTVVKKEQQQTKKTIPTNNNNSSTKNNETRTEIDLTIKPQPSNEVKRSVSLNDPKHKLSPKSPENNNTNSKNNIKLNNNIIDNNKINNNNDKNKNNKINNSNEKLLNDNSNDSEKNMNSNDNNNNSPLRNSKLEKDKSDVKQDSPGQPSNNPKSIIYPETFDSTTSIDDILSQNNSDLIPKSDVESLLKCLKRKLEEKEDAERASKKANTQASPAEPPKQASIFDEPADLFSSFDGSPESEEAASPNFFFQSRDLGSVSSVDSALSYNQQSSVSSDNSETNANNFNFFDEILADDIRDTNSAPTNEIYDVSPHENQGFVTNIGLVNTLHNHTSSDHIDFSFLDNLGKANYLECGNIFDPVNSNNNENNTSHHLSNEHENTNLIKNGGTPAAPAIVVETIPAADSLGADDSPESTSSAYTDNVSFPMEPAEDGDLFDHLWNELDNL